MESYVDFSKVTDTINNVPYSEYDLDAILRNHMNEFEMVGYVSEIKRKSIVSKIRNDNEFENFISDNVEPAAFYLLHVIYDRDNRTKTECYSSGTTATGYYDDKGRLFKEEYSTGYTNFYDKNGNRIERIKQ